MHVIRRESGPTEVIESGHENNRGTGEGRRWSGAAGKATVFPLLKVKGKETPAFRVSGTAVSGELTPHGLSQEPQHQVQHTAGLFNIQVCSSAPRLLCL